MGRSMRRLVSLEGFDRELGSLSRLSEKPPISRSLSRKIGRTESEEGGEFRRSRIDDMRRWDGGGRPRSLVDVAGAGRTSRSRLDELMSRSSESVERLERARQRASTPTRLDSSLSQVSSILDRLRGRAPSPSPSATPSSSSYTSRLHDYRSALLDDNESTGSLQSSLRSSLSNISLSTADPYRSSFLDSLSGSISDRKLSNHEKKMPRAEDTLNPARKKSRNLNINTYNPRDEKSKSENEEPITNMDENVDQKNASSGVLTKTNFRRMHSSIDDVSKPDIHTPTLRQQKSYRRHNTMSTVNESTASDFDSRSYHRKTSLNLNSSSDRISNLLDKGFYRHNISEKLSDVDSVGDITMHSKMREYPFTYEKTGSRDSSSTQNSSSSSVHKYKIEDLKRATNSSNSIKSHENKYLTRKTSKEVLSEDSSSVIETVSSIDGRSSYSKKSELFKSELNKKEKEESSKCVDKELLTSTNLTKNEQTKKETTDDPIPDTPVKETHFKKELHQEVQENVKTLKHGGQIDDTSPSESYCAEQTKLPKALSCHKNNVVFKSLISTENICGSESNTSTEHLSNSKKSSLEQLSQVVSKTKTSNSKIVSEVNVLDVGKSSKNLSKKESKQELNQEMYIGSSPIQPDVRNSNKSSSMDNISSNIYKVEKKMLDSSLSNISDEKLLNGLSDRRDQFRPPNVEFPQEKDTGDTSGEKLHLLNCDSTIIASHIPNNEFISNNYKDDNVLLNEQLPVENSSNCSKGSILAGTSILKSSSLKTEFPTNCDLKNYNAVEADLSLTNKVGVTAKKTLKKISVTGSGLGCEKDNLLGDVKLKKKISISKEPKTTVKCPLKSSINTVQTVEKSDCSETKAVVQSCNSSSLDCAVSKNETISENVSANAVDEVSASKQISLLTKEKKVKKVKSQNESKLVKKVAKKIREPSELNDSSCMNGNHITDKTEPNYIGVGEESIMEKYGSTNSENIHVTSINNKMSHGEMSANINSKESGEVTTFDDNKMSNKCTELNERKKWNRNSVGSIDFYQALDHVTRIPCNLSQSWTGSGSKDMAFKERNVRLDSFDNVKCKSNSSETIPSPKKSTSKGSSLSHNETTEVLTKSSKSDVTKCEATKVSSVNSDINASKSSTISDQSCTSLGSGGIKQTSLASNFLGEKVSELSEFKTTKRGSLSKDSNFSELKMTKRGNLSKESDFPELITTKRGSLSKKSDYSELNSTKPGNLSKESDSSELILISRGSLLKDSDSSELETTKRASLSKKSEYSELNSAKPGNLSKESDSSELILVKRGSLSKELDSSELETTKRASLSKKSDYSELNSAKPENLSKVSDSSELILVKRGSLSKDSDSSELETTKRASLSKKSDYSEIKTTKRGSISKDSDFSELKSHKTESLSKESEFSELKTRKGGSVSKESDLTDLKITKKGSLSKKKEDGITATYLKDEINKSKDVIKSENLDSASTDPLTKCEISQNCKVSAQDENRKPVIEKVSSAQLPFKDMAKPDGSTVSKTKRINHDTSSSAVLSSTIQRKLSHSSNSSSQISVTSLERDPSDKKSAKGVSNNLCEDRSNIKGKPVKFAKYTPSLEGKRNKRGNVMDLVSSMEGKETKKCEKFVIEKYLGSSTEEKESRVERTIRSLRETSKTREDSFSESRLLKRAVSLEELSEPMLPRAARSSSLRPEGSKFIDNRQISTQAVRQQHVDLLPAVPTPSTDISPENSLNEDHISQRIKRKSFYLRFNNSPKSHSKLPKRYF